MSQLSFYQTTIGKKVVMAASGLILVGFVIVHTLGNLQIFLGAQALNDYAEFLHSKPAVVWGARFVLLGAIFAHFWSGLSLIQRNRAARPKGYAKKVNQRTNPAALTMKWGGITLLVFIVYHLMHFTIGGGGITLDPNNVYQNVVTGFSNPLVSGFYVLAQVFLGLHLYHGVWSMVQTLGLYHPRVSRVKRPASLGIAVLVAVGNISIPVAVIAKIVQ